MVLDGIVSCVVTLICSAEHCLSLPSLMVASMHVAAVDHCDDDRSVGCIGKRAVRIALPRAVSGELGME